MSLHNIDYLGYDATGIGRFHVTYEFKATPGDEFVVQSRNFPAAVVKVSGGTFDISSNTTTKDPHPRRGDHVFNTSRFETDSWVLKFTEPTAYVTFETVLNRGHDCFAGENNSWMDQDIAKPALDAYTKDYIGLGPYSAAAPAMSAIPAGVSAEV